MKPHVNQSELFDIAQVKQKNKLIEWLNKNQISYRFTNAGEVKGEVWTTQKQIDDSFDGAKKEVIRFG